MRLIIGGRAQGKRAYLSTLLLSDQCIIDGEKCSFEVLKTALAVDKLHLLALRWIKSGLIPEKEAVRLVECNPEIIFTCDEIGCGIVPMSHEEREWREAVGRMCCILAQNAQIVERVYCGIPRIILKKQ